MSLFILECCCADFRENAVITFSRSNAGFRNDVSAPLVVMIGDKECDHCPKCGEKIIAKWLDALDTSPVVPPKARAARKPKGAKDEKV